MKLRVGLVGLGDAWQVRYVPALRALADRFEVRAICDQVRHRAEHAAADFQADAMDGYHALARREDIDALMVLAPQWYGALPILAACDSGKAVYCAAGLDIEAEEALQIKHRVEQSGIAFVFEFARRQAPATIRLRELIACQIGLPELLFCHQRLSIEETSNHYLGRHPPHPTFRTLIEQVDWCRYVINRPPSYVTGVVHRLSETSRVEDYQMLTLDFSEQGCPGTGPAAQISCGRYVPARWKEAASYRLSAALQVSCERGIAFIDPPSSMVWFDEAGRHQESLDSERPVGEQLLTHFFREVTSLVRHTRDLQDAYQAICVIQAARNSHEQGKRVALAASS